MSAKLVLVTGITGFIAGHVALAFLDAGFRVRGTFRGEKTEILHETVKLPGLEFIRVDDMASGDFSEALKDVDILIHVASPLPGHASTDDILKTAIDGTLNVLKQATAHGIRKIVITGSMAAIMDADQKESFEGLNLDESCWGNATLEETRAKSNDASFVYMSSKTLSERAVWQFAREHPEVNIATILPPYVLGPYAKPFPFPTSPSGLGANTYMYFLMTGRIPPPVPPYCVDVRDVAKAHLKAALLPHGGSDADVEDCRFILCPWVYTWKDAIADLNKRRPDIKTGKLEDVPELPGVVSKVDTSRAENVLGIEEWISSHKTVEDAIDSLAEVQKTWKAD